MDLKPIISGEGKIINNITLNESSVASQINVQNPALATSEFNVTQKPIFGKQRDDETIETRALSKVNRKMLDPEGVIPNGVYRLFRLEKRIKLSMLLLNLIFAFSCLIICILFAAFPKLFVKGEQKILWTWYIVPVALGIITFTIFTIETIELLGINNQIKTYRDSIRIGQISTPAFIPKLYLKLIMKQVRRTWLLVAILFYVGLFTLIFWALQDATWGALKWKEWIHKSFPNPNNVVYILCAVMASAIILFIVGTILRKKRLTDIQSFFSNEVIDYNQLQVQKSNAHKFWAKVFFISILVLLVIPFIIYIIVKKVKK
ncbi:hypothetical protein JN00_0152 [Metamycoplasma subdolum]|uniref:Uncharacterized protein n=1 Tax=Metamycoplasma subdolum TaxID=92407 RepID=A0A3M0A1P5_9BACT|nr:hypothetical protein [Metamycoplasma subdolum]RMA79101.1 hypothetical protein JN00_0152 [Metamycoplasma subdolum]WPB50624.1 hypothetical protein R9C05_00480 [Metamycoplasma subdolum]